MYKKKKVTEIIFPVYCKQKTCVSKKTKNNPTMEMLAPLALAAVGSAAANGLRVVTGGRKSNKSVRLVEKPGDADANAMQLNNASPGTPVMEAAPVFDPVRAHFETNAAQGRVDNIQVLRTVDRDPKYALTPESGADFQYDQMKRGSSHLENQWYYSNLTKDSETPLSLGYLPEYGRSSGVMLRNPDTPDILKPKKRDLLEEEVFVAQPEEDRRFYTPVTAEQGRRARITSKMAGGNGALDGFYMNDSPSGLGGPTQGFSTGLEMTRQFTGFHPRQRFFRQHDNQRQRTPHGFRAGNRDVTDGEISSTLEGQYTNEKKQDVANYHRIAAGSGGRKQPHLAHELRKVELRYTQRNDVVSEFEEGMQGRTAPSEYQPTPHNSQLMSRVATASS